MGAPKKQSVLHGAVVLMSAAFLVKIIGAVFKIPLTNLLGGDGMGYFSTAYGLFNPIYALSIAGMPVALAKLTAENLAKGRFKDVKRLFRIASLVFFITGTAGFLIMLFGARGFVSMVNNNNAYLCVIAISPAILFGCTMSIYRGYYEGFSDMYPTAVSQVVEAVIKLIAGYTLAYITIKMGESSYQGTGNVFFLRPASESAARQLVLSFGAAGAILGVTLSTLFGTVYLAIRHRFKGDGISKEQINKSFESSSSKVLLKKLLLIAIPVCLGSVVTNLTSIIDLWSVMNRLAEAIKRDPAVMINMYKGLMPENITLTTLPNYLFGTYQGLAINIFNLVPALAVTFCISALPAVTTAWTVGNMQSLRRNVESVLRVTSMLAFPAGLGMTVMSGQILSLLYGSRPMEVKVAEPLLLSLGIAVIFVSVAIPIYSMLQAVGRADIPVKLMITGGAIKLIVNFYLVAQPGINIKGAPIGTLLCYAFIGVSSVICLVKYTHLKISVFGVFGKPLLAGGLCSVSAWVSYGLFSKYAGNMVSTVCSLAIAAIIYVISLGLLRAIRYEDVKMLPFSEKILKTLAKFKIIG